MVKFEKVKCNLCTSEKARPFLTSPDRLHPQNKGSFTLVKCTNCGLIYQNPRPTQDTIGQFYPEGEYYSFHNSKSSFFYRSLIKAIKNSFGTAKSKEKATLPERFLGNLVKRRTGVPKFTGKRSILDVGCGDGFVLSILKEIGWDVYGTEISPMAVEMGKKNGLNIFLGRVEEAKFPNQKFDYVRISHTLEHLPDPAKTLKELSRILKPKGKLIILVPNYNSFSPRVFRSFWMGLDLPRHFYVFTPKTLKELLQRSGFEILKLNKFGSKGLLAGLTYLLDDFYFRVRGRHLNVNKLLTNQVLVGFDLLAQYLGSRVSIGDNMEVWANKQ